MHINYELIGQYITITESKNKSLINIKGKIVDETRNTLTIKTSKGEKKLIKNSIKFETMNGKIDGKKIIGKPENRIKR